MTGFKFQITLLEPVLIGNLAGDPNSASTLDYIPGSVIRGMLINAFLRKQPADNDAATGHLHALFFSKQVRFLNAYPFSADSQRTLPVPNSLKVKKSDPNGDALDFVANAHLSGSNAVVEAIESGDSYRSLQHYGVAFSQGSLSTTPQPVLNLHVHTQRDAEWGRATRGAGAVYRYESLPKGESFEAVILGNETEVAFLQELLSNTDHWQLGKSRSAGYGQVQLSEPKPLPYNWREADVLFSLPDIEDPYDEDEEDPIEFEDFPVRGLVQFTALSDLILRNSQGMYTNSPIPALMATLGLDETHLELSRSRWSGPVAFTKTTVLSQFNRKWSMPTPQIPAIKAGSVFVLHFTEACPLQWKDLLTLEKQGLGGQRTEGFGRIAFASLEQQPIQVEITETNSTPPPDIGLDESIVNDPDVQFLLDQLLKEKVNHVIRNTVTKILPSTTKVKTSNAQLNRWRAAIRDVTQSNTPDIQLTLLNDFFQRERKENKRGWKILQATRLESKPSQLGDLIGHIISGQALRAVANNKRLVVEIPDLKVTTHYTHPLSAADQKRLQIALIDQLLYQCTKQAKTAEVSND